jgi:hypothetical protein
MSFSVTGKLNQAASQFQAGESTGFGIRLGQQYYDRETKQKEWTNYEAVVFAKQPQQIQYYQSVLVEGSIITISGDSQKIKVFDGQNGQRISIEILNANLGFAFNPNGQQGQYQQQSQQQYQQPQQQPQQQNQFNQQSQQAAQQMQQAAQHGGFNNAQAQPQQQAGFAPQQDPNNQPF